MYVTSRSLARLATVCGGMFINELRVMVNREAHGLSVMSCINPLFILLQYPLGFRSQKRNGLINTSGTMLGQLLTKPRQCRVSVENITKRTQIVSPINNNRTKTDSPTTFCHVSVSFVKAIFRGRLRLIITKNCHNCVS